MCSTAPVLRLLFDQLFKMITKLIKDFVFIFVDSTTIIYIVRSRKCVFSVCICCFYQTISGADIRFVLPRRMLNVICPFVIGGQDFV